MSIEESIKVLDEIAEGFEKLSEDVCARADIKAMWEGRAKGIRQAIAVINAHLRGQPNDPMTLSELREMDGEPVWVELIGLKRPSAWYLLNLRDEEAVNKRGGFVSLINYGDTWTAYRHKPEEDAK